MIFTKRWRRNGWLLILMIFGWIGSQAQNSSGQALKAYYSFDDCVAQDHSGNNSHGTLENDQCKCGASGESLYLRGNDSRIELEWKVNEYFNIIIIYVVFC